MTEVANSKLAGIIDAVIDGDLVLRTRRAVSDELLASRTGAQSSQTFRSNAKLLSEKALTNTRVSRLEERLRNMEACVTSDEFELRRELRKLEG